MIFSKEVDNVLTVLAWIGAIFLAMLSVVQAGPISGVTVTTNMGNGAGSNISNISDGSGLISYDPSSLHDVGNPTNSWAGNLATGTVTFDLHGTYLLSGLAVWNLNAFSAAGVRGVHVMQSVDGTTYVPIPGSPGTFAKGSEFAWESAEVFNFVALASYVRLDIVSNYGHSLTGLSEVMFLGSDIPEPATIVFVGAGVVCLALLRRRQF